MSKQVIVGRTLTALVGWLAALPLYGAVSPRAQLENYLATTSTLEARFVQTLTDEQGEVIEVARGTLYLDRPGRFRWEYTSPYQQSIVADGETLWIYDRDLEQVTRRPLDGALTDTPAALLGNELDLDESFVVSEETGADGRPWLRLTSKSIDDENYSEFRLAFDADGLRAMKMTDNFGQQTLLEFSDERRNQKIDPDLFRFEPPPGVDVFDAGNAR